MYRFEAISVAGFVQQLAVSYLGHGYWFYVMGEIPEGKDVRLVDEKLLARYRIDLSKWARARRKRVGFANLHYLRYDRVFLLLATHGSHPFFLEEASAVRDAEDADPVPRLFHQLPGRASSRAYRTGRVQTAQSLLPRCVPPLAGGTTGMRVGTAAVRALRARSSSVAGRASGRQSAAEEGRARARARQLLSLPAADLPPIREGVALPGSSAAAPSRSPVAPVARPELFAHATVPAKMRA